MQIRRKCKVCQSQAKRIAIALIVGFVEMKCIMDGIFLKQTSQSRVSHPGSSNLEKPRILEHTGEPGACMLLKQGDDCVPVRVLLEVGLYSKLRFFNNLTFKIGLFCQNNKHWIACHNDS